SAGPAPAPATVPDVVGLTQAAATAAIADAGLTLGAVTTASSPTVPEGSVVSQTPDAGAQVASDTAVALVVSSGPAMVTVPGVVGLTQAAAVTAITNAGLTVGTVNSATSPEPAGVVLAQDPSAGSDVLASSAVDLLVSSGPPVEPPKVTGVIGIDFAGFNPSQMSPTETAGVIPKANWNVAPGRAGTAMALQDEAGASTGATVSWSAVALWLTKTADTPGDRRMMKGYLATSNISSTTVTVAGLPMRSYDVYVYLDSDNRNDERWASYTISGPGITTASVTASDA